MFAQIPWFRRSRPIADSTADRATKRLLNSGRLLNPEKIRNVLVYVSNESIWNGINIGCRECLEGVQVRRVSKEELDRTRGAEPLVLVVDEETAKSINGDFRKRNRDSKIVLLTNKRMLADHDRETEIFMFRQTRDVDFVFELNMAGVNPTVLAAMSIRACEDLMNIEIAEREGAPRARRFIFLIVDDEPQWFSKFLPALYEIIGMRASVMIARTFEQAREIIEKHGDDVVFVSTDVIFPREGKDVDYPAGKDLVALVKERFPRIPVLVASTKGSAMAGIGGADFFIIKGANDLEELRRFIYDRTGMGDFVFLDKGGEEAARARNLGELYEAIKRLSITILEEYANGDKYSTWLYMHGFDEFAGSIKKRQDRGEFLRNDLLKRIKREIKRVERLPLVIKMDGGTRLVIRRLEELAAAVRKLSDAEFERCAADDSISTWLMVKGYADLADKTRRLHSHTEGAREKIATAIEEEMARGVLINGGKA
ncbi:MAG: hypothetical protein NT157_06430 [Candidatus Micrarchaeota archaeon]|nr:hypothetical protein [Candidatus Micrarchaeota archaeon]